MSTETETTKRVKPSDDDKDDKDDKATTGSMTHWTSNAQVNFGQTLSWGDKKPVSTPSSSSSEVPAWLSTKKDTGTGSAAKDVPAWLSSNNTPQNKDVPAWLSKPASAPQSTDAATFGAASTFGAAPASFGNSATFGATFGGGTATFGGTASFGAVAGESVFGSATKKKPVKEASSEAEADAKDSDDDEVDNESDVEGDGNDQGSYEPAPASWGTRPPEASLPPPEDVTTGEENERQVYQTRAKLFKLHKGDKPSWSELGVGPVRINIPVEETANADGKPKRLPRIIMRRQGVLKLLLNAVIVPELGFEAVGENMIRFACESFTEDNVRGELATFLLKFGREEERNKMLDSLEIVQPPKRTASGQSSSAASDGSESTTPTKIARDSKA